MPITISIPNIDRRFVIEPSVIKDFSEPLNLGSGFLRALSKEVWTNIEFRGDKTTLNVGGEKTELIRQMDERGRRAEKHAKGPRKRTSVEPERKPQAIAESDTRVKARSLRFVRAKIPKQLHGKVIFVSPKEREHTETVGALYNCTGEITRVAVMNTSDQDVVIRAGLRLGELEAMESQEGIQRMRKSPKKEEKPEEDVETPEIAAHKAKIIAELGLEENPLLREHPAVKKKVINLVHRYWKVFGEPDLSTGLTDLAEFSIQLKPGATPQRAKLRPLNPHQIESLEEQMKIWLDEGVIEPAESPWASALVPAKKKGGKIRWAIDYRSLNKVTVADSFPLPSIEMNLEKLAGAKVFSALDAAAAYNVIPVAEASRPLLAFITPMGLFQYKRMPFGPRNSGAVYARFIEQLLSKLNSRAVVAYLDDILVFTGDLDEHVQELERVLEMHQRAGIKLRPAKTKLFSSEAEYLGFKVSEDGVAMQEGYVERILSWPTPKNPKELNTFLGFVGYYRSFIKDFAKLTFAMNGQRREKTLTWTTEMEADFQKLKEVFRERPIRSYPRYDIDAKFEVTTDFSSKSIGGILSQVQDGKERLIGATARKCSRYERNYPSVKGELSALIHAVRKWEHILRYRPFIVNTDSQALKYLTNLKCPTGIWFRWLEELQSYDFEVRHRPGKENTNADSLSRSEHHPEPTAEEVAEQEAEYGPQLLQAIKELDEEERIERIQDGEMSQRMRSIHQVGQQLSREVLQQAQEDDEVLAEVRGWVERGERPEKHTLRQKPEELRAYWQQFQSLRLRDGLLYNVLRLNSQGEEEAWRVALPEEQKELAFKWSHCHLTAGHFGVTATLKRSAKRFFFPGMTSDIKRRVQACPQCIAKRTRMDTRAGVHRPVATGAPGQEIFIDLVGPLPLTEDRLRYCLTVEDSFTRHVHIFPLPNKTSGTVVRTLIERYFAVFGIPHAIKSDNGREFVNNLLTEVCERLQLKQKMTPVYNPHSNGVERFHRTLNSMLRTFTEREDMDWPRALPAIAMAYNSKVHAATGTTPFFATYGREMRLPIDMIIAPPECERQPMDQYLEGMLSRFRKVFAYMRKQQGMTIRRSASLYKGKTMDLKIGDKVWYLCPRQIPGKPGKITDHWLGPYRVTKKINDVVYQVRPDAYEGPPVTVHEQRLLKCTADLGSKSRIPTRLQIQDEGDELAEEIRPPGQERDEPPDDGDIPIAMQNPEEEIMDTPGVAERDEMENTFEPVETGNIGNGSESAQHDEMQGDEDQEMAGGNSDDAASANMAAGDDASGHDESMPEPEPPEPPAPDVPPDPPPLTPPAASGESPSPSPPETRPRRQAAKRALEISGDERPKATKSRQKLPKPKPVPRSSDDSTRPGVKVQVSLQPDEIIGVGQAAPKKRGRPKRALSTTDTASSDPQPGTSGLQRSKSRKTKAEFEKLEKSRQSVLSKAITGRGFSSEDETMDRIRAIKEIEVLLDKDSEEPKRSTAGSAAYDCWAAVTKEIPPGSSVRIPLRLRAAIPEGFFMLLLSRSGLASRGITTEGGVIDADYRGGIDAIIHNSSTTTFKVVRGQRITQGVFLRRLDATFKKVEQLPPPDEDHGGFGSTGAGALVDNPPMVVEPPKGERERSDGVQTRLQ